jgi:hypothetical protein
MAENEFLLRIKRLVAAKQYRVRIHAVLHMIDEGFTEAHICEAITGPCTLLEDYRLEKRCLIGGRFHTGETTQRPLHIVCDDSVEGAIDIVTAYIPRRPWWMTPKKRGRTRR